MKKVAQNLFENFNISLLSQYFAPQLLERYYYDNLKEQGKRTRSDYKISCHNMILFILLWLLHPEQGYLTVLHKAKTLLINTSNNVADIAMSITAAGLCKARRRFSSSIIKKLWQNDVINTFIKEKGLKLWKGFRVCAFDGTTFTLNKSKDILNSFPLVNKARFPKMIVCILYDVYSKIPLDIETSNFKCGERSLLSNVINRIKAKTLLLLDRGYPSYWIFHKLHLYNLHFVIRMPKRQKYIKIKKLYENDWIVQISLYRQIKDLCKKNLNYDEYKQLPDSLNLRLIKTQIKGFRPRFIITSLLDEHEYSFNDICQLYCDRWIIENYYRDLKHIYKVEKFHAHYVDGIYQEIYASMILTIILQDYIIQASLIYAVPFDEISFKKTFQIFSHFLFILELFYFNKNIKNLFILFIANSRQKKRPGRYFRRIFYRRQMCMEYKSR